MKILISSIIFSLFAQGLFADQASYANERPYILGKAEKAPLLKAELLKKHGMYEESAEILTQLINNAKPFDEVDEFGDFLVKTSPLQTTPLSYLYYSRASCWDKLGQHDKALNDYIRSHELDPDPSYLYEIAHSYYELNMNEKAVLAFNEYLEKEKPDRLGEYLARYFRVVCACRQGSISWGLQELNIMKNEFPEYVGSIQKLIDQVNAAKTPRTNEQKSIEDREKSTQDIP